MVAFARKVERLQFWDLLPTFGAKKHVHDVPTPFRYKNVMPLTKQTHQHQILVPVVPHKAVAEVSKIGNL